MLHVPQYKDLSIKKLLIEGRKDARLEHYLPDDRDMGRLPRYFIMNLCYTIVGQPIKDWVSRGVHERNHQIAENRNLIINLDPAIATAFKQSVNISSKYHSYGIELFFLLC